MSEKALIYEIEREYRVAIKSIEKSEGKSDENVNLIKMILGITNEQYKKLTTSQ